MVVGPAPLRHLLPLAREAHPAIVQLVAGDGAPAAAAAQQHGVGDGIGEHRGFRRFQRLPCRLQGFRGLGGAGQPAPLGPVLGPQ
ncbi:MAG: hypothetical protein ACK559_23555, partial [bacterium]